jgi:hypothetical protein
VRICNQSNLKNWIYRILIYIHISALLRLLILSMLLRNVQKLQIGKTLSSQQLPIRRHIRPPLLPNHHHHLYHGIEIENGGCILKKMMITTTIRTASFCFFSSSSSVASPSHQNKIQPPLNYGCGIMMGLPRTNWLVPVSTSSSERKDYYSDQAGDGNEGDERKVPLAVDIQKMVDELTEDKLDSIVLALAGRWSLVVSLKAHASFFWGGKRVATGTSFLEEFAPLWWQPDSSTNTTRRRRTTSGGSHIGYERFGFDLELLVCHNHFLLGFRL